VNAGRTHGFIVTTCATVLLIPTPGMASGDGGTEPYSKLASDVAGSVIASRAAESGVPVLVVAGVTYKAVDLAHDIGEAAVEHQDRWLDAQLVLVDHDSARLKQLKNSPDGLNGSEAKAIEQRVRNRLERLAADGKSPVGYTGRVIVKNLPYAVSKVTMDKAIEAGLTHVFFKSAAKRVGAEVNWALNYGGPLEDIQKGLGWGKLGSRARAAERLAAELFKEADEKAAMREMHTLAAGDWENAAADALQQVYQRVVRENPSAPRTIQMASFRLEALRTLPELYLAAPTLAEMQVPAQVATMAVMRSDPVVSAIRYEDRGYSRSSGPTWNGGSGNGHSIESTSSRESSVPDARTVARDAALHAELMAVGDGKTYASCSNGCPGAGNSWDGSRGQTLNSK
jgi:hypothetical protein